MLRYYFLAALLLASTAAQEQATDPAVAAIQADYRRIRSERATYRTRPVDLSGESAEGGVGTAYYAGKRLQLLEATYYGEMGKQLTQYYYHNGQLCFALSSYHRYNRPFYYDKKAAREAGDSDAFDPKKTVVEENRYYFQNGQLIRWLNPANKLQPVTLAAKSEEYQELLANEAYARAAATR